mmetsp:Transcript_11828/g.18648  ORF Transcript_11828/g.18648 Transcript_11828/m.18648 type:complete len:217 (+) Transcript_11828:231-881(+)
MVELKASVYDEHNPPLVPATLAPSNNAQTPIHSSSRTVQNRDFVGGPMTDQLTSQPPPTERNVEEPNGDPRMVASGVAGAVLGFMFGGPILATLFGFGSAYATQKGGATGDAARALGDVAIVAKVKAEELDKKHNVVEKSKKVAAKAWEQAKEYDRKHNVLDQAVEFAKFSWKSLTKFAQDHRLLERGVSGVGRSFEYVADRVTGDANDAPPAQRQ